MIFNAVMSFMEFKLAARIGADIRNRAYGDGRAL